MNRFGRYSFFIALLGLFLAGCDTTEDPEAPPPLIPAEAFSLQTNLFSQDDSGKTSAGPHFTAAALRVWPVSVIVSANLIVPVAVTVGALQDNQPERNGTTWTWTSTTVADGREVTFTLEGTVRPASILWSMRVSFSDGQQTLDDFELYIAVTDLASQTGTWQLFYQIDGQRREVLDAEFFIPGVSGKTITYSIPLSADRNAGDSVRYEVNGDERVFNWNQVEEGFDHLVTWNAATRTGSITATNYNNGDKVCWGEDLENAACVN